MTDLRKHMLNCNDNLGWCKCLSFNDGTVFVAVNEGDICGLCICGKDLGVDKQTLAHVAKLVNADYDLYEGYTSKEILFDADYCELPCRMCPWFDICEAMD